MCITNLVYHAFLYTYCYSSTNYKCIHLLIRNTSTRPISPFDRSHCLDELKSYVDRDVGAFP